MKLEQIEKQFAKTYGLRPFETDVSTMYQLETRLGVLDVWFDYEDLASIFTRFDTGRETPPGLNKTINPYSGKLNYHGIEIDLFLRDMEVLTND